MSRRKMFSIIMIVLLIFLFINLFIPFVGNDYEGDLSLWDYFDSAEVIGGSVIKILIILELVISIIVCVLQLVGVLDDFKFVYFGLGFYFTYYLSSLIGFMDQDLDYFSGIGIWIGIILSFLGIIVAIFGNRMNNETNPSMYGNNNSGNSPIGYDPKTGRPIYARPMNNNFNGSNQIIDRPVYR